MDKDKRAKETAEAPAESTSPANAADEKSPTQRLSDALNALHNMEGTVSDKKAGDAELDALRAARHDLQQRLGERAPAVRLPDERKQEKTKAIEEMEALARSLPEYPVLLEVVLATRLKISTGIGDAPKGLPRFTKARLPVRYSETFGLDFRKIADSEKQKKVISAIYDLSFNSHIRRESIAKEIALGGSGVQEVSLCKVTTEMTFTWKVQTRPGLLDEIVICDIIFESP